MEQRIKQRLIGAVVLVALAVIFLPILLSGPVERTRVDIELDMPEEPEVRPAPTLPSGEALDSASPGAELADDPVPDPAQQSIDVTPEPTAETETETEAEPAAEPDSEPESETDTEPATEPEPEAAAEPEPEPAVEADAAVFVQVGSFASAQNAERLADRLRADGIAVRVVEESNADAAGHRVQVGPLEDRSAAERMAQRLAQDFELPGFIIEP